MEAPNWAKKRGRAVSIFSQQRESKEPRTAEEAVLVATEAAASAKGGKHKVNDMDIIEELINVVGVLSLQSAGGIRASFGVLVTTFLGKVTLVSVRDGVQAGIEYSQLVQDIKERKEDGEDMNEEDLDAGSPHIMVGMAFLQGLQKEPAFSESTKNKLNTLWQKEIADKEEETVEKFIKSFRCRKPKKQTAWGKSKSRVPESEYAKITFNFGTEEGIR